MNLLVLTSRFPYPIEKGDKLRAYYQIRELSKHHAITLVSLSEEPVGPEDQQAVAQFCKAVHIFPMRKWEIGLQLLNSIFRQWPAQVAYFWQPRVYTFLQQLSKQEEFSHLYCQLIRMAPYVTGLEIPATLDYMDTFSVGMARRAGEGKGLKRAFFQRETRLVKAYEQAVYKDFSQHCIISEQDRAHLPLAETDKVAIIPNGIDTHFFSPSPNVKPTYELVFVGNMGYFPNVRAALMLVREIMPLVWAHKPDVRVLIAGARPNRDVQALAKDSRVHVSGWVADIRDAYQDGKLLVAPLFTGSGQQNKILEAMSLARPCLTTTLVNNAIGAETGVAIEVADSAQEFASSILRLLPTPEVLQQMGKAGRQYVSQRYGWEQTVKALSTLFKQ